MTDKIVVRIRYASEQSIDFAHSNQCKQVLAWLKQKRWIVVCEHPMLDMRYRFACKPTRKQIKECVRVTREEWHEIQEDRIRYMEDDENGYI